MRSAAIRLRRAEIFSGNGWLAGGNFGDSKSIGESLHELRIDWGLGYRVYHGKIETACVLLLCGGDKRKQSADIKKARAYWKDYQKRLDAE